MNILASTIYTTDTLGIILTIVCLLIILGSIFLFFVPKHPSAKVYILLSVLFLVGLFSALFDLKVVLYSLLALSFGCLVVVFGSLQFRSRSQDKENKHAITDKDEREKLVNDIVSTLEFFSARKIGAIISFERNTNLNTYINKAVQIDGEVSPELLKTVFFPNTALHDGAVIIRGNRIVCAAAYYPLTDKSDIPSYYGTRHRAAIGISEETDAFSVVVSEETGQISYTIGGTITSGVSEEALKEAISQNLLTE